MAKYRKTAKGIAAMKRAQHSEAHMASKAKYEASERGNAGKKESNESRYLPKES